MSVMWNKCRSKSNKVIGTEIYLRRRPTRQLIARLACALSSSCTRRPAKQLIIQQVVVHQRCQRPYLSPDLDTTAQSCK